MFIKTANAHIVERIADPNLIVATKRFPNFAKRTAAVQPIRLYPDKFLYLRNRSISAMETHGPNQNGDAFPRRELMNRHSTFIGTPVTVDHTEERVVGMVLDSVWVPKMLFKAASKQLVAYDQNNIEPGDQIVGDWEADPINKKISHTSPLGQALVGKKAGDKVEVKAPAGKITYKILAIE